MNKNKENIVPELRFPEFVKSKGWEMITLGELCNYWNGASHESNVVEDGNYYLISLNSLDINGNLKTDMKRISNTDNSLQKHDLVMVLSDVAHGNFLGLTDIIPNEKYVLNQRMAGLRLKKPNFTDAYYLKTLINFNQSYFKQKGQGSSQLNLAKSSVTDFNVLIPCDYEERKKIADCLSSLDELITAQNNKIDLLKSHKKGLMQNIFPAEGETKPKLRFREFENEWTEKSFEELFEIGNGRDYKHLEKGNIPVYGSGGYMLSVNEYLYEGESACIGRKGTIDKPMLLTGKFWTVDTLFYTHSFKNCIPKYIYYVFQTINWLKHNEAGGVPSLSKSNIYKIKIKISSLTEQQKIVDILTAIDKTIEIELNRLEELKNHKKGLMQKLFPKVN